MNLLPEMHEVQQSRALNLQRFERLNLEKSSMSSPEQAIKLDHTMDYAEIVRLLPHRPPILLVDRVLDYTISESILAMKSISISEPVFAGHFPGQPIYPGVYIIEGLAQASALLTFKSYEETGVKFLNETLLTGIEDVRFRKKVVPGDALIYKVKIKRQKGAWAWFSGQAEVNGEVVAEASFSARTVLVKDE